MSGQAFLVEKPITMRAFLFVESPLLAIRILRAMPSLMLVHALPRHLFAAKLARPSCFERWLWGSAAAMLATFGLTLHF